MKYLSLDGVKALINSIKNKFVSSQGTTINTFLENNRVALTVGDSETSGDIYINNKAAGGSTIDIHGETCQINFFDESLGSTIMINGQSGIMSIGPIAGADDEPGVTILGDSGEINASGSITANTFIVNDAIKILNPSDNSLYTLDIAKCIELGILKK